MYEAYRAAMQASAQAPCDIAVRAPHRASQLPGWRPPARYRFMGMYIVPAAHPPSILRIQQRVAEAYAIPLIEMTSQRRSRIVARPRQVAMYLAKTLTPRSLAEIGRRFGGRDHTTVIHAVRQIEKLMMADKAMDARVRLLAERLGG